MVHTHPITVYYEDTDFTGVVYHANYLKYFERAREHLLGVDALVALYRDQGVGFVVYRAELTFKEGARHGDRLAIRTEVQAASEYRLVFAQAAWRQPEDRLLVKGSVDLVCVDRDQRLVRLPEGVLSALGAAR